MLKKLLIIITIMLISFTTISFADDYDEEITVENFIQDNIITSSTNKTDKPVINSRKYTIYDRKSGLSVYGKDENKQSAMASTTKIMTRNCCDRKVC